MDRKCHIAVIFIYLNLSEFFYRDFLIPFNQKTYLEVRKMPSSPLTYFGRTLFFPSRCVLWFAPRPEFARTTSSRQSLTTLMHHLEQTRARIRQEQIDRTLRRQAELRIQYKREERLVREKTQPLLRRTESLSRSLFESQREAFILRERIETLSKSFLFLSRLCFLLCVCLALVVVHQSVDLSARHGSNNQMDIQGREWTDI